MRIAQIAPLFESVPPKQYGGTERVVAYLVDELVAMGHAVTLFASGDSRTSAHLINCRAQAMWLEDEYFFSDNAAHLTMLDEVRRRADEFDIIHVHVDLLGCPLLEDLAHKTVITLHGRLDINDLQDFYQRWPGFPLVSISDSQRQPLNFVRWVGTVYHGLPTNLLNPVAHPSDDYVVFLGRLSPEKQPEVAIEAALKAGRRIKVAAKIEPHNRKYYHECLQPLMEHPDVEFVGEVDDAHKKELLGNASALLFPVNWPEPFGIVMIEAFACGTPVIAWNRGAVSEVVEAGVTGFIVDSVEETVDALRHAAELDRQRIRVEFEQRFTAGHMARGYLEVFEKIAGEDVTSTALRVREPREAEPQYEPVTVESEESTMPYQLLALKHKDMFVVANSLGDIVGRGDGVFRNDTRVLSNYSLRMAGKALSLLSSGVSSDDVFFNAHATNRPLPPMGESSIPEGILHVQRSRFIWQERLYEHIQLVNYGEHAVEAPLEIHFGADFRDIFEVRGLRREARGRVLPVRKDQNQVTLGYCGLDGVERCSVIAFSQQPRQLTDNCANFRLDLPRRGTADLYIEIGPKSRPATGAGHVPSREAYRTAAARARRNMRLKHRGGAKLHSAEPVFQSWLDRSRADLSLLTTEMETGPYPYAGIPWFSTPFGRDAVITALQTLWFDPRLARGVLRFLAANQATENDSFRDSSPGKIMHETRKGEMSQLNEVPFGLYYGGVDTTPLFVMLAGAYVERTADLALFEELRPALKSALEWIEDRGNTDIDGFLGYQSGETSGLRNQGWKDSEDSVFHEDGRFPEGPISLVEVQGYKFAALTAMAQLSERLGESAEAQHWLTRAEEVRRAVEHRFWMDDKQFYGLALDGAGKLCRVRASNAGHLLFTGLPTAERGRQVCQQLLSSSFDSGWGVRTLATDECRYNPMSYHNGSIWPHDTALCAAGMARYGERRGVAKVLSELFAAAMNFDMRLPELFCGFPRMPGEKPIAYPVACLPQAWASGSVFLALQACLGITIDPWRSQVLVQRPTLPNGINHIAINRLQVGDSSINLMFHRVRDRVTVFAEGPDSNRVSVVTQT